jgi:hypothetical protein
VEPPGTAPGSERLSLEGSAPSPDHRSGIAYLANSTLDVKRFVWLRRLDLHQWPSRYERDELLLLHSALNETPASIGRRNVEVVVLADLELLKGIRIGDHQFERAAWRVL